MAGLVRQSPLLVSIHHEMLDQTFGNILTIPCNNVVLALIKDGESISLFFARMKTGAI